MNYPLQHHVRKVKPIRQLGEFELADLKEELTVVDNRERNQERYWYDSDSDSEYSEYSDLHFCLPLRKCLKKIATDRIQPTAFSNLEEYYRVLIENLQNSLAHVNRKMIEKEEEVRSLTTRIAKIKATNQKQKASWEMGQNAQEHSGGVRTAICIFPEEVWRLIFANLTECDDLWNCTRACKHFQTIIDPSKATFILYEIFPTLYKYLTGDEISRWSRVCPAWNSGIHHFFENCEQGPVHGRLRNATIGALPRCIWSYNDRRYGRTNNDERTWDHESSILRKWENAYHYGCKNLNPTARNYGRGFHSCNSICEFIRNFRKGEENSVRDITVYGPSVQVEKFLMCFGQHVRFLSLTMDVQLLTCLSRLVPNLRQLCLPGFYWDQYDDASEILIEGLVASPHLQTLQIDAFVDSWCRNWRGSKCKPHVSHPVVDVLIKTYHLQLRKLNVRIAHWDSNYHLGFPNLTELNIHMCQVTNEMIPQTSMPNLRKLGLRIEGGACDDFFDDLMIFIIKLSRSTRLSTLRLTGKIMGTTIRNYKALFAPSTLTTLEVNNFCWLPERQGSLTCYNFLLYFPFVETIKLYWENENEYITTVCNPLVYWYLNYKMQDEDRACRRGLSSQRKKAILKDVWREINARLLRQLINVHKFAYKGRMYESNIWELLPRLKVFTFQKDVYTREKYVPLTKPETNSYEPELLEYFELITDSFMLCFGSSKILRNIFVTQI